MLCELSLQWLHREVLCPIISDKCSFLSKQLTYIIFSKPFTKISKEMIQTPSMAKLRTRVRSSIISTHSLLLQKTSKTNFTTTGFLCYTKLKIAQSSKLDKTRNCTKLKIVHSSICTMLKIVLSLKLHRAHLS